MNRTGNRIERDLLGMMIAVILMQSTAVIAQGTFVMPSGAASASGPDNLSVPFLPGQLSRPYRYQQVFGASDISIPFGAYSITAISFRLNEVGGSSLDTVIPDIEVRLSTTPFAVDRLQGLFAVNVGNDETVVFPRGSLHIAANFAPGNVRQAFDIRIPFSQSFSYDRSGGNLLLDVINYGGSSIFQPLDAFSSSLDSVSSVGFSSLIEGSGSTRGLATEFAYQAVPEPMARDLMWIGTLTMSGFSLVRGRRT